MFRIGKRFGIAGVAIALAVVLSGCHSGDTIAVAGSDTTNNVMKALTDAYNGGSTKGGDVASNIPPVLFGDETFSVEGDSHCGGITYNATNKQPPFGSSAGINALVNDTQGCIDVARSSRGRSASDPANLDFYAFGRDGLSWARFGSACPGGDAGPAGCAPTNLSQAQLQGIFICDQGSGSTKAPKYTNWAQLGGDNEPIRRYLPQLGSGTLSFFETRILGLTSAQQAVVDDANCTTKPVRVEENVGTSIGSGYKAFSIVPYSYAVHTAQANGVVTDQRGGALLGSINGVAPTTATISANTFLGTRYVYNVTKSSSPSYARALNFVGVRPASSGGNGFICSDNASVQSIISQYGFVPLSLASAGAGLPNSRCRKNPAPL